MTAAAKPELPGDLDPTVGFGTRVRAAMIWRSGSQILAQMIAWSSTLIVIRLLDPADYGLFAMTQMVIAFLAFLNGYGFAAALVQSQELTQHRIRQAFGLLLLLNGGLALAQYLAAPIAAAYFRQPLVADMLRVQALIFIAMPFIALPEVLMSRTLEFRRQALVNLTSAVIGAVVALVCALNGFGVWTLVYAPIAMFWTRAIGLTLAARLFVWPSFDFRGCGSVIAFGSAMLASHFFWLVQVQADIFIAGRRFDVHTLGYYAQALFFAQIFVSKFVPPLNDVAFPAYARIQSDPAAVTRAFLKSVRLIMLVAAPVYAGLAVTAAPMVETLLSAKWLGMVPYIQILAIALPLMTVQVLFAPAVNAMGRPGITMQTSLAGAILFPAGFLIGASLGGLIGMTLAWLVCAPLLLFVTARLAAPVIHVTMPAIARSAAPGVMCALAMAGLVLAADSLTGVGTITAPLRLAALVLIGGGAYPALLWLLQRDTAREMLALVRRRG